MVAGFDIGLLLFALHMLLTVLVGSGSCPHFVHSRELSIEALKVMLMREGLISIYGYLYVRGIQWVCGIKKYWYVEVSV